MTSKTIALSGAEIRVNYSGGTNAWLRNDGTTVVYASTMPGVTAGADGVVSIPAGQAAAIYGACGTVYLLGTGMVQLVGSDYTACPFKVSTSTGGESGVDEVARGAIAAHEGNAGIHISAAEKATWNGKVDETDFTDHKNDTTAHVTADEKGIWNAKAELSDIPTTLPANGGNADTLGGIPASELKRVAGAVMGGASAGVQWAGVDCQKGDVHTRMQVDADYDRILLFKSTDGGTSWEEIPLGNADTLDGLHESSFAQNIGEWSEGDIKDLLLACQESGFVWIQPGVAGMPYDGTYWFGTVNCNAVHRQLTAYNVSNTAAYIISWNNGEQSWKAWKNIADGGNAASVGAYTEAKIAALEARIAALEGGGT